MLRILPLFLSIFFIFQAHATDYSDIHAGVVQIDTHVSYGAYSSDSSTGSGFVVDMKEGLIATNEHVASPDQVRTLEVKFFNGSILEAEMVFYDPMADIAILKVDPTKLSQIKGVKALKIAPKEPTLRTPTVIIGSSEGYGFSEHPGLITNLYETAGFYGLRCYGISISSQPGSSGSPVLDAQTGQVIAIQFASDDKGHCFGVPAAYLKNALSAVKKGTVPPRKWSGAMLQMLPVNKALKMKMISPKAVEDYQRKYPQYRSELLMVKRLSATLVPNSPLEVGDIIWTANGQFVGGDQLKLEDQVNRTAEGKSVTLEVWREGELISLKAPLLNPYKLEGQWMVQYASMVFFDADMVGSYHTGLKPGSVLFANMGPGSPFGAIDGPRNYTMELLSWCGHPVNNFQDFLKALEASKIEKNITMKYRFSVGENTFNRMWTSNSNDSHLHIHEIATPYPEAIVMHRKPGKYEWKPVKM